MNNAASFYSIGDIEEAFTSIEAYEEVCDKYGEEVDRLNSYNVLFLLYEYNKEYDKAKETLEKSIELGMRLGHSNIVSNGYSNYSHVCNVEGNYFEALEKAEKGLEMAKLHKPSSSILELRVTLNIANAYIGIEDFDASRILIDEMINNPVLDSFIREKSQCYDLKGRWYTKKELYREAFNSLTYSKELIESYNDVNLLKGIQEQRIDLCELMKDIPLGYIVQKEYISLLTEISERNLALAALKLNIKHEVATIEKKANTDDLTGLFNRDYMESTTNYWLKQASENNESIVCLVFDLDNLKSINDQYGHLIGDEVIKEVSKACSTILKEDDLIGRFGGDEFVIILKDESLEFGTKKAEQLLETIRNLQIVTNGKNILITASIGVAANSDSPSLDFNDLFNVADIKLYEAKQNGKNQICVFN